VVDLSMRRYFATFRRIIEATLVMAVGVATLRLALLNSGAAPAVRLVLEALLGSGLYVAVMVVRDRTLLARVRQLRSA
jgi:hypothetical protein